MKLPKSLLTAAPAVCAYSLARAGGALAATGEKTPLNLSPAQTAHTHTSVGGGGSLVHTLVGLAIVIAVIYGLYWVLKQVKASREEKASGTGLEPVATMPLGTGRTLHVVRAGTDVHLLGVTEHGVTPIKTYGADEAERVGLVSDSTDLDVAPPYGSSDGVLEKLRRLTVLR
jgi:flagellar protein FliO/FliZ